jgi:ABC-2 type transport system ATP-binding protein
MDGLAIDLRDVAKTYGRSVRALRGIRMEVRPGEIFGLLGPNGAGKSTLVKIMMTVIRPSRAEGTLLGRPIGHKPTLARVGYLPEHRQIPAYLTSRQALDLFASLSKVDRRTRKRRIAELLELVGMTSWADARIGTYSKGMQQRIALAQALVHDPDLIVLDEPTDGLDPVGRREVRQVLLQLRDQGKTVFLNSHLLGELERVCDRVAILLAGEVIRQGTIEELTAGSEQYEIEVGDDRQPSLADRIRQALPCVLSPAASGKLPSGETVTLDGLTVRVVTGNAAPVQAVIDGLRAKGLVILAVRPVRQSLEDYFLQAVTVVGPFSDVPTPVGNALCGVPSAPVSGDQRRGTPQRAFPTVENGGARP